MVQKNSKKIVFNSLLFAINTFGSKLIVFILVPLYTHFMTDSQLGIADLIYSTASIMLSIFTLRISASVLRFAGKTDKEDKLVLGNAFLIIVISTTFIFFTIFLAILFKTINSFYFYVPLLYLLLSTKDILAQYCKAKGKTKIYAIDGIVSGIAHLLAAVLFLVYLKSGIHGYLLSIIVCNFISIILLAVFGKIKFHICFSNNYMLKTMLNFSIPLVPNSISWRVIELSDRYMVTWFVNAAANGVYTIAYKIPAIMGTVADIFFQAWMLTTIDVYDGDKNYNYFQNIYACFEGAIFIASSIIICFNPIISKLLYSVEFQKANVYGPLLVFALVFSNIQNFFSSFFSAAKKTKDLLAPTIIAALLNIILNLFLIPTLGVYGAIISTCLCNAIMAYVRIKDSRKFVYFPIKFNILYINILLLALQAINEAFNQVMIIKNLFNILLFVCVLIINKNRLIDIFITIKETLFSKIIKI